MLPRRAASILVCLSLLLLTVALLLFGNGGGSASRAQLHRSMAAPETDEPLYLQWVRHSPPLIPAWPDQSRLPFDIAAKPVVLGKTLFVGSSRTDSLTAIDTETGAQRWRFFANGPIRLAPAVGTERVYCAADDGYLYCLDAVDGHLLWKFRGGPADRQVLGNERLISTWPARGGPVVADGVVYFAAGIWPFMGIFLHALDADTGRVIWTTDGDGSLYIQQPHGADSFAGIAPQGSLAVAGDKLLVPNGRSVPACYDRRTGKLLHYRLAENGRGGGSEVTARNNLFLNGGVVFDLAGGEQLGLAPDPAILTDDALYCCSAGDCQVYDGKSIGERKGYRYGGPSWTLLRRFPLPVPKVTVLRKAGGRFYGGAERQVFAIDLPRAGEKVTPSWQASIEGTPVHLLPADGRLFVSTRQGQLYCFGPQRGRLRKYPLPPAAVPVADDWTEKARDILKTTGVRDGYCVAWGAGSGRLITELAQQSSLRIIAVEPDADRATALREQLLQNRTYAERVAIHVGSWDTVILPPYLASVMVAEDLEQAGVVAGPEFFRKAFASLRPYGGVACLPVAAETIRQVAADTTLVNAQVRATASAMLLIRAGALPGAANWTHEHADAANTRVSRDQLVKAPLGVLWFGGPSHDGVLPRHGHGPQPQVIDGRLLIEGADMLRALDIYTGRLLWQTSLPGVGQDFDELWHQPGANASGTNFISTSDAIYVAYGPTCLRLDPATGKLKQTFALPASLRKGATVRWSYLNVAGEYLIGGVHVAARERGSAVASSKHLVVMNRHTGKVMWTVAAQSGFRHNAICVGGGRLYAIDRPAPSAWAWRRDAGETTTEAKPRLVVLDLRTGKERWSTVDNVFGTWLSYSERHDVLVEAGRQARDTLYDEPDGMRAYRADRGTVLWHAPRYAGPAMIHGDIILKDKSACDLRTGAPVQRRDPLTGRNIEWTWTRDYGCNTPLASEHLLTFRSGAAGFFDLANDSGTGNLGGFRSGCTNNLIVAGGLLTAADYTRTCTCSYQNQTSLALIHMPEAEMWTYLGHQEVTGPVRRAGISFGAPGNRKGPDGTLWLEFPRAGGPSPRLPVTVVPDNPTYFRHHASWVKDGDRKWVAASGARGLFSATVTLDPPPSVFSSFGDKATSSTTTAARRYTVRLYFIEPDGLASGERVFDVALQGKPVLVDFDISSEAGGPCRTVVKEFQGVEVTRDLTVTLTPAVFARVKEPVLCGIEVVAEGW